MSRKEVRQALFLSDTHCGDGMGLLPPSFSLDNGNTVQQGRTQKALWAWWREMHDEWLPYATNGEPYAVVMNGDALEGVHHGSVAQVSQNMEDQIRIAETVLRPIVDACSGRYYHIRGTGAHSGQAGQHEENLARRLGAIPNEDGHHARWDLWLRLGKYLGHATHHIGTVHSPMSEATAIHAELVQSYVEAGRWGDEPPDFIVRSHRHRSYQVRFPSAKGEAVGIVTPAWQGRTEFTFKISGARMTQPQFGAVLVVAGTDGIYTKAFTKRLERSKEVSCPRA